MVQSNIIDILMSAYNGERYIETQLDSIISQSYTAWKLYIRDDGSSDKTTKILEKYRSRYPGKIAIIVDSVARLGPTQSFNKLLSICSAEYIAFADQDDYWLPNKLALQIDKMTEIEKQIGGDKSILVHTDLVVVDHNLTNVADSFWKYQKLHPEKMANIKVLLTQNFVTGCTMLINRPLLKMVMPVSVDAIMHDRWIGLIALLNGRIINLPQATVQYRQHSGNAVGAKKWGIKFIYLTLKRRLLMGSMQQSERVQQAIQSKKQALALSKLKFLSENDKAIIHKFIEMHNSNWFMSRVLMLRYRFRKYGFIRTVGMFILL